MIERINVILQGSKLPASLLWFLFYNAMLLIGFIRLLLSVFDYFAIQSHGVAMLKPELRVSDLAKDLIDRFGLMMICKGTNETPTALLRNSLIEDLKEAYAVSGCSSQHMQRIDQIMSLIMDKYNVRGTGVCINGKNGGSYQVTLFGVSPEQLVNMNFDLVDAFCDDPQLDDCRLTPQFVHGDAEDNGLPTRYAIAAGSY